jgi:hypothetical protein
VFTDCFARRLLGVNACSFAEEAGGNYAGVVEDDEFAASEEVGEH